MSQCASPAPPRQRPAPRLSPRSNQTPTSIATKTQRVGLRWSGASRREAPVAGSHRRRHTMADAHTDRRRVRFSSAAGGTDDGEGSGSSCSSSAATAVPHASLSNGTGRFAVEGVGGSSGSGGTAFNAKGRARELAQAALVAHADTVAVATTDKEAFGASRGSTQSGLLTRHDPRRHDGNTSYDLSFWQTWRTSLNAQKTLPVPKDDNGSGGHTAAGTGAAVASGRAGSDTTVVLTQHGGGDDGGDGGGGRRQLQLQQQKQQQEEEKKQQRQLGRLIPDPQSPPVAHQQRKPSSRGGSAIGTGGSGGGSPRRAHSPARSPAAAYGGGSDGGGDDAATQAADALVAASKPRATTAQRALRRRRQAAEEEAQMLYRRQTSRHEAQQEWEAHLGERVTVGELSIKRMVDLRRAGPDEVWLRERGIDLVGGEGEGGGGGRDGRAGQRPASTTAATTTTTDSTGGDASAMGRRGPPSAPASVPGSTTSAATRRRRRADGGGDATHDDGSGVRAPADGGAPEALIQQAKRYLESRRGWAGQSGRQEPTARGEWLNRRVDGVVPPAPGDVARLRDANFTDAIVARNAVARNRRAAHEAAKRLQPEFRRAEAARRMGPTIRREVGDELEVAPPHEGTIMEICDIDGSKPRPLNVTGQLGTRAAAAAAAGRRRGGGGGGGGGGSGDDDGGNAIKTRNMYSYYAPALGHFPDRAPPPQNHFTRERRSFQPPSGAAAALKFDYRKTIETPALPTTVHGRQFESRFKNRGSGAFLDTTGPGHYDLAADVKEGAGPGYFEQTERDLAVLNRGRGHAIPEAPRFVVPGAKQAAGSVPGPAAYNVHNRTRDGLTMGTGVDSGRVAVSVPKARRDLSLVPASDSPGPKYYPRSPAVTGLAGGFASERVPSKQVVARNLPQMEGIFGLGCSVEEHILYGQCLDGRCSERAGWEVATDPVDKAQAKSKWTGKLLKPGLLFAARDGKPALIRHFLKGFQDPVDKTWSEPPDIDMTDGEGRTPLHMACLHGQLAAAMTLLTVPKTLTTRPANPDLQDKVGRTALHYAAAGGNYEIVKELLFRGADPGLLDREGRAAEDLCHDRKHRVYQLLKMASVIDSTRRRTDDVVYRKKLDRDVYSKQWDIHTKKVKRQQLRAANGKGGKGGSARCR